MNGINALTLTVIGTIATSASHDSSRLTAITAPSRRAARAWRAGRSIHRNRYTLRSGVTVRGGARRSYIAAAARPHAQTSGTNRVTHKHAQLTQFGGGSHQQQTTNEARTTLPQRERCRRTLTFPSIVAAALSRQFSLHLSAGHVGISPTNPPPHLTEIGQVPIYPLSPRPVAIARFTPATHFTVV